MKTIKTILLISILATLVLCIDTSCKVSELNARLDDLRDTWVLATTPVSEIEEIEVDELKTPDGAWKPRKEGE